MVGMQNYLPDFVALQLGDQSETQDEFFFGRGEPLLDTVPAVPEMLMLNMDGNTAAAALGRGLVQYPYPDPPPSPPPRPRPGPIGPPNPPTPPHTPRAYGAISVAYGELPL